MCEDAKKWGVDQMYKEGCPSRGEFRCSGFLIYYDPLDYFGIEYARGWDSSFWDYCETPNTPEI